MATTTINSNPPQNIRVEQSSSLSSVLPTLAAGEVVRVSVRSKQPNGQGMIGVKGQLIKALLPGGVEGGDRLLAQITQIDDAVVLKILGTEKTSAALPQTKVSTLTTGLKQLAQSPGTLSKPLTLNLNELPGLQEALKDLGGSLQNSQETLTQLKAATSGSLAETLRNSSASIQKLLDATPEETPILRFMQALEGELTRVLERSVRDNADVAQSLQRITTTVSKQLNTKEEAPSAEEKLLKFVLGDLSKATTDTKEQSTMLESALNRLQSFHGKEEKGAKTLEPKARSELQAVATQLNSIAHLQESLNELNPLMQALGEPALILFPALFQGILAHSEVTVDPRKQGKKRGKGGNPYERIQMKVPLPAFGEVSIDIAYRQAEILVRFVVNEEEKEQFISEHLEELGALLRKQGFQNTELSTHTGSPKNPAPDWSDLLQAKTSLIA